MENMARLALVEQSVKDKFSFVLQELLKQINYILENPQDNEVRTLKCDVLKNSFNCEPFRDYLMYIGFKATQNEFIFPKDEPLKKLIIAKAAIERKIELCCEPQIVKKVNINPSQQRRPKIKDNYEPSYVLRTTNSFLLKIEALFNDVLKYEDEKLQQEARDLIPLVTLELRVMERMREQQKKIKTGETKESDLAYEMALLLELLGWFKHKFFTWVNSPPCDRCHGATQAINKTTMIVGNETCNVEAYKCMQCNTQTNFPRYNDPRTLLFTRRGRCGEWANCFTLMCRALGYDTRYVYDTTDHVWCEVFDYISNSWLHVDPCEGVLNTPLMYCHGWGKQLCYVIAVCKDDIQDVTWKYSIKHTEVLKRRTKCSEVEMISSLMQLRDSRQSQVSPARRKHLTARALRELVDMMVERKPSDFESKGRISGSKEWRTQRGEIGAKTSHTFQFDGAGEHVVRYCSTQDKYRVYCDGVETKCISNWASGTFETENLFRKVEEDWRQVYIAREEGTAAGTVAWRLSVEGELLFTKLTIKLIAAVFETGNIAWTLQFDEHEPMSIELGAENTEFSRHFKVVKLSARLSGGLGDVSWQHTQLFRQSLDSESCSFQISARVE